MIKTLKEILKLKITKSSIIRKIEDIQFEYPSMQQKYQVVYNDL